MNQEGQCPLPSSTCPTHRQPPLPTANQPPLGHEFSLPEPSPPRRHAPVPRLSHDSEPGPRRRDSQTTPLFPSLGHCRALALCSIAPRPRQPHRHSCLLADSQNNGTSSLHSDNNCRPPHYRSRSSTNHNHSVNNIRTSCHQTQHRHLPPLRRKPSDRNLLPHCRLPGGLCHPPHGSLH